MVVDEIYQPGDRVTLLLGDNLQGVLERMFQADGGAVAVNAKGAPFGA